MYVLFDDAGKFLAGRILSEADSSLQVELPSGKRQKVKAAAALLRFEAPAPQDLLGQALSLSTEIDLNLAWEFAPEDEFGFVEVANDYFGCGTTAVQQAAALMRLFEAPHYFRRAGKGRFRKAPEETVQQALAAIAKKAAIQADIDAWSVELAQGRCPEPVHAQLYKILFKPDKNAPEYKAVVQASKAAQADPLSLLQRAGAISNAYQFHWQRFLFEQFAQGTAFAKCDLPEVDLQALPQSTAHAYSIDDATTTEIDDALSVQGLGSGTVTLGIHIAVPALGIRPDDAIDHIARHRMSTVYMPGHKITMLPDAVVERFTLRAGQHCPALSLYVTVDEASCVIQSSRTALERVWIADNLRHDHIEDELDQAFFDDPNPTASEREWVTEMRWLYTLALARKAQRETVRGKPELFNRPDYNFALDGVHGEAPTGDEIVRISQRRRGSPLDLIVAECMIVANQYWGQWLADLGVPGIYRSQASMAPGVKVRMSTKALPHAGIGVPCYAWSTSPLRRYTDLVNQWQLLACAQHGNTAALVAPFKPKDAALFAIISNFESTYASYNEFQRGMERFWTLRHLEQAGLTQLEAQVINDKLVRADSLPLVMNTLGAQGLPRGARVRVGLGQIDLIALEVTAQVVERLDAEAAAPSADDVDWDDDANTDAGGLKLAMTLESDEAPNPPESGAAAG
jgi:exoribonuclease II